jgi:hypothetical protein
MKFRIPPSLNAALAEAIAVCRTPQLLAWAIFIIFFPIYVLPNGMPQPASWLLILLMPATFGAWDGQLGRDTAKALFALLRFVVYAALANLLWSLVTLRFSINLKEGFLLSPLFYIYNALLLATMLVLHKRYGMRFLWVTTRAILVAVTLQVFLSFIIRTKMRASVGFNEPNQLGYYALLCACIILLCQKRTRLTTLQVSIGLMMCSYLAILSASKAALAGIGLLGAALLLGRLRTTLIASLVLLVLVFTPNPFSAAMDRAQERIETDEHLGFWEERGYDRILNHPEYWFLGSGEGAYRRFRETTAIRAHELHSSIGTLFFSYGIVGTALFAVFMWLVMRGTPLITWLVVMPAFAYGMTHQGIRFSMMWVLLGVVMTLRDERETDPRVKTA